MYYKNFDELIAQQKSTPHAARMAVAAAGDEHTIEAVLNARAEGIIQPVLVGDKAAIDAMRTVKWYVDCGDDDFLLHLSMDLYSKMRAKNVKCEFRVRNGGHTWEFWHTALRFSLPFASQNWR